MGSPGVERVEVVEGVGVGRAVPRDGHVAGLARESGAGVVPRALLELRFAHSFDDGVQQADPRDRQQAHRVVDGGIRRRWRRLLREVQP